MTWVPPSRGEVLEVSSPHRLTLIGTLPRSWRRCYRLAPVKRIGVGRLFSANSIGFMANVLFPARLGEFVRAYVLGGNNPVSATTAFATIVVERL